MEIVGWGCELDLDFYAWNRCLGVCGVRSWGLVAKATHGPAAWSLNRGPYFGRGFFS